MVKVGCCGIPGTLAEYVTSFRTVEIQDTFYQPPHAEVLVKWRESSHEDFEFTVRAWQLITHEPSSTTYRKLTKKIPVSRHSDYGWFRPTRGCLDAWKTTRQAARALRAHVVVFETPAGFTPTSLNMTHMRRFFEGIDREDITCAWEPKGSWPPRQIQSLCKDLDLVHAVDPFRSGSVWGDIVYLRLHGSGGTGEPYSHAQLKTLASHLKNRSGYCFFGNAAMGDNAATLCRYLG